MGITMGTKPNIYNTKKEIFFFFFSFIHEVQIK
jgi:hypothetical protein